MEVCPWYRGKPRPPGTARGLVAAYARALFPPGQDRRHEAEPADAAFEGVEFVVADPSGVGGVRTKEIDRDFLDGEGGESQLGQGAVGHTAPSTTPAQAGAASSLGKITRAKCAFGSAPSPCGTVGTLGTGSPT